MKNRKSALEKRKVSKVGTVLILVLMLWTALPLYVMGIGAFKPSSSLMQLPPDLNPFNGEWAMKAMEVLFTKSDIILWLTNSFIIAVTVAALTTIIGVTAGYAFARIRFYGAKILFALVIATMIMPKAVLMIPNYLVAMNLGLTDTMIGVILTTIGPSFAVFLARQCVQTLPHELFEAAEIDGASEPGKFIRIALPLTLPSMGTATIFAFFGAFNDYTWQLIMIRDRALQTVPIGISGLASKYTGNLGIPLAGAFVVSVPMVIIFLLFQKVFVKGATVGAVKG